jgi:uroporphyrinogen-III decarboxylase
MTNDYELIFKAARKCMADFDWDATIGNLIYNYAGVIKAMGWNSFAFPGIELPVEATAQYLEPPEEKAYMKSDEYDELMADPTAFLFNKWFPRYTDHVGMPGEKVTFEHNMSLLNGGMALQNYNQANVRQVELMRSECGTPMAIAGLLKAPLDILMDKLRGYIGVAMDLMEKPDVVLKACEALMPHICHFALAGADPSKQVPITIWMHRGCVPFISHEHFNNIYWPTLKPIVEEIWKQGHQVLFYAEGNWDEHLEAFAELPEKSIIYHVDQGDIFKAHKTFGHKFCLSGGIPNFLLSFKGPEDVRAHCKKVIDGVAAEGGYIMDASAIIQDDAKVENMQAMVEVTREYGIYNQSSVNKEPVLV